MIYKMLLLFILSPGIGLPFDKDLTTNPERVPLEFTYLIESLKSEIKAPAEKIRLVGLVNDLNDNLGFLQQREHILLLIKTEVAKNVLEYKFGKLRQLDITTLLTERLEEKLKKSEPELTKFSLWIWRSIVAELRHRQSAGIITTRSFSPHLFDGAKRSEAVRFQRYLQYLSPWLDQMELLTPVQFNELTKLVSWKVLERINERSLLFKRFSSSAFGDSKVTLVNIPQRLLNLSPEDIKRMQQDVESPTLKEAAAREKSEAQSTLEKITPEDLSPLSDELANELDKQQAD